ncbi:hypothetical protein KSS87_004336, partial [Heliosperma pusillum]
MKLRGSGLYSGGRFIEGRIHLNARENDPSIECVFRYHFVGSYTLLILMLFNISDFMRLGTESFSQIAVAAQKAGEARQGKATLSTGHMGTLHIRPNEKLGTIIACKKRGRTPLTEFFHQSAKDAAPKLLYGEFKELYRWDNSLKKWLKRKNKLVVLARLVFVAPAEGSQRFRACHNRLIFSGSSDGDSKPSIRDHHLSIYSHTPDHHLLRRASHVVFRILTVMTAIDNYDNEVVGADDG